MIRTTKQTKFFNRRSWKGCILHVKKHHKLTGKQAREFIDVYKGIAHVKGRKYVGLATARRAAFFANIAGTKP